MEPSPKRARLSGDEVEDGPTPPSLFDLSLHAMIENAKNEVYPIEVDKIPPLITDQIWKQSSLLDIIESICIPGTFELYSNRVIRPPKITIRNWRTEVGELTEKKLCCLSMEFEDGRTVDWEFSHALLRRPSTPNPAFLYQVGDQEVFTKIEEETENHLALESVLDDSWSSRIGIIEWLINAFHCEIDAIHLWDDLSYFSDLVEKWDKLESVRFLAIKECNYTELLHTLLPVRLERRLTTYVHTLNCPEPLRIRLTRKVEFRYIHSNVTSLSLQELPAYIWRILKICLDGFEFIIPNFNTQRIQFLKNDPDLSDNIDLLREKYEICPRSKEIFKTTEPTFYLVKQDRAFVHYFLEETPGVYNRWLGHYWEPKPQPVQ